MKHIILTVLFSVFTLVSFSQDKKQCQANTKAGHQCTRNTVTKYCKQHDPASIRCGAKTKSGTTCTRLVKIDGNKCFQHNKSL
jgi:hypothetical protein